MTAFVLVLTLSFGGRARVDASCTRNTYATLEGTNRGFAASQKQPPSQRGQRTPPPR